MRWCFLKAGFYFTLLSRKLSVEGARPSPASKWAAFVLWPSVKPPGVTLVTAPFYDLCFKREKKQMCVCVCAHAKVSRTKQRKTLQWCGCLQWKTKPKPNKIGQRGHASGAATAAKQDGGSSKLKKTELPHHPAIVLQGIYLKEMKTRHPRNTHTPMSAAASVATVRTLQKPTIHPRMNGSRGCSVWDILFWNLTEYTQGCITQQ